MDISPITYRTVPEVIAEYPPVETLLEQGSGRLNEDTLLAQDNLYGVFDGATSLNGTNYEHGLTGGYLAATLAAEVFAENDRPLVELAEKANRLIRQEMIAAGVEVCCKEELWSTSAAVVRLKEDSLEWCQTGDCVIRLIDHDGSSRLLVEPPDHDAETLQLWQQMTPEARHPIHVALADKIIDVRRRMNIDYGVLNGEREATDFVQSGTASLHGVMAILLYSDGLFIPHLLAERQQSQQMLTRLFLQGGLTAIRDHVRQLQLTDPACHLYPRFKTHDDISAIAIYQ